MSVKLYLRLDYLIPCFTWAEDTPPPEGLVTFTFDCSVYDIDTLETAYFDPGNGSPIGLSLPIDYTIQAAYPSNGNYTATLTFTDIYGRVETFSATVTVTTYGVPGFNYDFNFDFDS